MEPAPAPISRHCAPGASPQASSSRRDAGSKIASMQRSRSSSSSRSTFAKVYWSPSATAVGAGEIGSLMALFETYDQMFPNRGPLVHNDREQHRVADGAVVVTLKATQCPFVASVGARDGLLGSLVADVGFELHPPGSKGLEGVKKQKLRVRIDLRAQYGRHVERGSNFQPAVRRGTTRSDDGPPSLFPHRAAGASRSRRTCLRPGVWRGSRGTTRGFWRSEERRVEQQGR